MSQRSSLLCFQFRNAKYQGAVTEGRIEGLGIIIDSEYLWAISEWQREQPQGPTLVVYPNREYFWGRMVQGQPEGVGIYRRNNGKIYALNRTNNTQQDIACIEGQHVIHLILKQRALELVKTHRSNSEEESWQLTEGIINAKIPPEQRSGYLYVKSQIANKHSIVECSQQSGGEWIGFAGQPSLGVKFVNDQVRQVGGYEKFPRKLEFGKKVQLTKRGTTQVQEGDFANEKTIIYNEGNKPVEAAKQTQRYFKRGTNFKDRFVDFTAFQELSRMIGTVKSQHEEEVLGTYGQRILEENGRQEVPQQRQTRARQKIESTKTYTLEQVSKDIVAAAQRRQRGGGRIVPITDFSPERRRYSPVGSPLITDQSRSRSKEHYQYLREVETQQRQLLRRQMDANYRLQQARHQIKDEIRRQQRLTDYARHGTSYEEFPSYHLERAYDPQVNVNPAPRRTVSPYGKLRYNYVQETTEASPIKHILRAETAQPSAHISPYKNYINYKHRDRAVTPPKRHDIVDRHTGFNDASPSPANPSSQNRTHHKRSYKYV